MYSFHRVRWYLQSHIANKWQCWGLELGLPPPCILVFLDSMLGSFAPQKLLCEHRDNLVWQRGLQKWSGQALGGRGSLPFKLNSQRISITCLLRGCSCPCTPMNSLFCTNKLLHSCHHCKDSMGRNQTKSQLNPGLPTSLTCSTRAPRTY